MSVIFNKFLSIHKFSSLYNEFKDNYESHPNYPSLFAITDTLSILKIENVAANVPKDQLEELPDCFLGYVYDEEKGLDLALVEQNKDKISITFEDNKKQVLSINSFNEIWNGVVIAIEPNELNDKKTNATLSKIIVVAFGLFGLFFLKQGTTFSILANVSFFLYTIGFVFSVFIIQEKLGSGQASVSKLCSFSETTSCDSVINSSTAKINNLIDFSDLPIIFFSTSVLAMLLDSTSHSIINGLSLFSIPIVFYSIWLQKIKLKKWCILCLSISAILIFQVVFFLSNGTKFNYNITTLFISITIVSTLWFFIKYYIESNVNLEKNNKELKRFKRNFKVFDLLQKPLRMPTKAAIFSTIEIGHKENPVSISLALSPSCGHCHTAFEEAIKLYNSNKEKVNLSIFYNLNPENKDNPYLEIARNLMQINSSNPENCIEALSDWHIKKMKLLEWLFKWEQKFIDIEIDEDLLAQYEWCSQNEFNYTPVKIVNDREFSSEYEMEELKFFISDIEDQELKPINLFN